MAEKYPLTYEEYEQKIKEIYIKNKKDKEDAENRLNDLLKKEPDFIKGLYADTCFDYDHPEIYGKITKKSFEDDHLDATPVNVLNMLLGWKID